MNKQEHERFVTNVAWFNRFFDDMKQLFDKIARELTNEYALDSPLFYYPKSNFQPSIPVYYMVAQGGKKFAIQLFAILDPSFIEDQPVFTKEISLVMVMHSHCDKPLWVDEYGVRVIRNKGLQSTMINGVLSGSLLGKDTTHFHAFQVLLDTFIGNQDVNRVIHEAIIEKMRDLPDW